MCIDCNSISFFFMYECVTTQLRTYRQHTYSLHNIKRFSSRHVWKFLRVIFPRCIQFQTENFKKVKYEKWKRIDLYRSKNRLQSRKYDRVMLAVFASNDGFVFCSLLTTCHDSSPNVCSFQKSCHQQMAILRTFKFGITVQRFDSCPKNHSSQFPAISSWRFE